jgi:beta-lactam-binding protein with PASTA domain
MPFFAEAEFGAVLPGGAKVNLVVSRGKKRR